MEKLGGRMAVINSWRISADESVKKCRCNDACNATALSILVASEANTNTIELEQLQISLRDANVSVSRLQNAIDEETKKNETLFTLCQSSGSAYAKLTEIASHLDQHIMQTAHSMKKLKCWIVPEAIKAVGKVGDMNPEAVATLLTVPICTQRFEMMKGFGNPWSDVGDFRRAARATARTTQKLETYTKEEAQQVVMHMYGLFSGVMNKTSYTATTWTPTRVQNLEFILFIAFRIWDGICGAFGTMVSEIIAQVAICNMCNPSCDDNCLSFNGKHPFKWTNCSSDAKNPTHQLRADSTTRASDFVAETTSTASITDDSTCDVNTHAAR
jgi:hypothetical protein